MDGEDTGSVSYRLWQIFGPIVLFGALLASPFVLDWLYGLWAR